MHFSKFGVALVTQPRGQDYVGVVSRFRHEAGTEYGEAKPGDPQCQQLPLFNKERASGLQAAVFYFAEQISPSFYLLFILASSRRALISLNSAGGVFNSLSECQERKRVCATSAAPAGNNTKLEKKCNAGRGDCVRV
jgi:hypothetical protein